MDPFDVNEGDYLRKEVSCSETIIDQMPHLFLRTSGK